MEQTLFIAAYDQHAEAIFRYCVFRVFDRERAKEIMQETFTKTWEYMSKGRKVDNMKAFLYKVAHNLCVNEVMRNKAYSLEEMSEKIGFDVEDEKSMPTERKAEIGMLVDTMQMLKPEERELLVMRYVNDLMVSEIASILGALPNTVSVKINRAERRLKDLYEKNEK